MNLDSDQYSAGAFVRNIRLDYFGNMVQAGQGGPIQLRI